MERHVKVWLMRPGGRRHYEAQWVDPATGRRKTRSLRTDDLREAERKREWHEDRLNAGLPVDDVKLSWKEFRERFLREHGGGLRPRSREKLQNVLDCLEQECDPATVRSVDARMLARFVQGMRERPTRAGKVGMAPVTIRSYLVAVRGALAYAAEQGLIASVPKLPEVKVPRLRPRPVPLADYQRLADAVPGEAWRALLMLGWAAGLRMSEALELRRAEGDGRFPWLDLAALRIWIPAAFSKGCEDQWVPLHPELAEALRALPQEPCGRVLVLRGPRGGAMCRGAVSSALAAWQRKAGVRLSMHRLRKGFGCRLAGKAPAAVLQRLMRHASISTTMDYYATAEDACMRDAVNGL